ncbi:substrate-binding domain-containing protein [Prosthecomicrobium pneumaticum]|uniref:ABC-type sugar transport system substrate-binding protein n=1 Tax=Prosthecomicrobium pneumaticum TaxID=81895 RepID=A0A7W9CT32_9HYPH|nr:substrate-binding domain-containing protein [Prosthecomicrobium pneumaticum]MBB5751327.1 ABC-type sugar transport system substrate-binding protein [Prosthecomicrobium pneumaticum]
MTRSNFMLAATAALALSGLAPIAAHAATADELMTSRLGTTTADPAIVEAIGRAAQPVTPELRAKALECWNNNGCDTGTGGAVSVAYADGFGENVWRRVTAMEFIQQALTYPEIGKIQYSSARGDASKAISDLRSYIAQGVNVIVIFADHGAALGPTVREAKEAGIQVVLHNGTEVGTPGTDYLTNIAENICQLGKDFVKAVREGNPEAKSIVALGGVPGNTLSSTWQDCADQEVKSFDGLGILGRIDTNWTQEGTFTAVSTALSQYDKIDGYIYEYADGFRGAVRAYQQAGHKLDFVAALRTDEQGLFCDWEKANDPAFKIYYSSGQNFQSRFALTAAMMAIAGKSVPARIDVPFKMKPAVKGLCNPALPMEMSVSTMVDAETLKAMFAQK